VSFFQQTGPKKKSTVAPVSFRSQKQFPSYTPIDSQTQPCTMKLLNNSSCSTPLLGAAPASSKSESRKSFNETEILLHRINSLSIQAKRDLQAHALNKLGAAGDDSATDSFELIRSGVRKTNSGDKLLSMQNKLRNDSATGSLEMMRSGVRKTNSGDKLMSMQNKLRAAGNERGVSRTFSNSSSSESVSSMRGSACKDSETDSQGSKRKVVRKSNSGDKLMSMRNSTRRYVDQSVSQPIV
jgi:hypothetical protein